jgi:NitT/TauT family transport system substrate-binding protein
MAMLLGLWTGFVTLLHVWLNVSWAEILNERLPPEKRKLNVAYIPVT